MFNRLPKRIAGPGFHVNVRYDDQTVAEMRIQPGGINKSTSSECYDVKEMELLVTKKQSGMYNDGYTHCFSSLNGYDTEEKELVRLTDDTDKEEAILKSVSFVGVAVTEYIPSKAYSEQGFVSQIGGVVTLLNESSETIHAGQKVRLGVDFKYNRKVTRQKGIPRDKLRFCIKPVKKENLPTNENEIKEWIKSQDLVIGKALGLARAGDRVEVLLQPRHCY